MDDAELGYFAGNFSGIPPGADVQSANGSPKPCDPKDTKCEPPTNSDVAVLANITTRNLDEGRLCEMLVVELNNLISYPSLYDQASFGGVDLPEGSKALLEQERASGSRYHYAQDNEASLKAQPESEEIDDQLEDTKGEIARLEAVLLPLPRLVQLNRRLLVASFPGLLTPTPEEFDKRNANMVALGLLWICAGGALGWILAGGIFDKQGADARPARRGGLRGIAAALGAAPAFVVAYVLALRLANLVHDTVHFQHELHYLWDSTENLPDDILGSTLVPTALRLDGYWAHKWTTLGVFVLAVALLAVFWEFYGRKRGMARAVRWRWLGLSAAGLALLGIVSDANIPFVYLLVGLVWITPAVFLGFCSPYLRTGSAVPPVWGIVSLGMGIALVALTILRLWWSAIPFWLCFPGIVLIGAGLLMRAGRNIEEYWPLGALALGLIVCGTSAIVQRATFLGVLSDVHELNANAGYGVKLWPNMPKLPLLNRENAANASQVGTPLGGASVPGPTYDVAPENDQASTPPASGAPPGLGNEGGSLGGSLAEGFGDSANPDNSKAGTQSPGMSASTAPTASGTGQATPADVYQWAGEGPTHLSTQELLTRGFEDQIDFLRWKASVSTGDYRMDQWIESRQKDDEKRLRGVRDDVARLLELSIVGSLGFWLTVGLLAGWAMQQRNGSNEAGGPN